MARTDANPPMPEWSDEYQLVEVDADYLAKAVKPYQEFLRVAGLIKRPVALFRPGVVMKVLRHSLRHA